MREGRRIADRAVKAMTLVLLMSMGGVVACHEDAPEGTVLIPAGPFTMGTNEEDAEQKALKYGIIKPWFEDERPAHQVSLRAFYIDQYEITNEKFQLFVRKSSHRPPPYWREDRFPEGTGQLPVVMVSWYDARDYCIWEGKRLPTEAEWEKAARPDSRQYPWGNSFDPDRVNTGGIRGGLTKVGSYPNGASPHGVMDLIGNVWEWTADWYAPYPESSYEADDYGETRKVLRGSSWATVGHYPAEIVKDIIAHNSRGSFRLYADPHTKLNDIGFRCAKSK